MSSESFEHYSFSRCHLCSASAMCFKNFPVARPYLKVGLTFYLNSLFGYGIFQCIGFGK